MCGISAIVAGDKTLSDEQIERATAALDHRGPDGRLTWIAADRTAALGHTRLDITTARTPQPIPSEDRRYRLIANGEFYDYARLRHNLQRRGHRFHTDSDSEIALHLYEDYGAGCLEHLRGEFAFAIWDQQAHTLFAARDRFGIKPLFYCLHAGQLLLASEAKALFAVGVPPRWDAHTVYMRIFGCFESDRSLFAGIHQIPPGHYLTAHAGAKLRRGPQLRRYWALDYPTAPADDSRDRVAKIGKLLHESVRLRMQAHVPVGCLLSGGLDSSTILALATLHSEQTVHAFTISFDEQQHDESADARQTAAHLGVDLTVVSADDAAIADNFAAATAAGEMIQFNAHGVARFLLSRAIQQAGYRSVLAGEGADELFGGYAFARSALVNKRAGNRLAPLLGAARLFKPLDQAEQQIARTSPSMARLLRLLPVPPRLKLSFGRALALQQQLLDNSFALQFDRLDPYWTLLRSFDWRGQLIGRDPAQQLMVVWFRSIFANYHLAADRLDMAHAVEVRLPFLDHHLFEHVRTIATAQHTQHGWQKYLLRRIAESMLPHEIVYRPKQPFYAPPLTLRSGSRLRQLVGDTLHSRAMADLPFFDGRQAQQFFERSAADDPFDQALYDPILLIISSLCQLQQHYRPTYV